MMKRCKNCDAPKGKSCPRWVDETWGFMEKNIATGEQRFMTGCYYEVSLRMLMEVARSMNSAAAAAESARNAVDKAADNINAGFAGVAHVLSVADQLDCHLPTLLIESPNGQ